MQVDSDGVIYDAEEAPYVWIHPDIISDSKFKTRLNVDLCPEITHLATLTSAPALLKKLIDLLEKCMKHNFIASILTLAASIQAFHYEAVVKMFGGCPITMLRGDPETGKSKSLKAALSLFGGYEPCYYVKGTNASFLERASESTLPFVVDDPNLQGSKGSTKANFLDVHEIVVDLYNGAKTANALKGSRTPRSVPLIASNFNIQHNSR